MANKKPNILVIWGDDIGQSNLSCYTRGMMGYQTPNIDRVANEGMLFTDQEFPPRQKAASFTVDQVLEKLVQGVPST